MSSFNFRTTIPSEANLVEELEKTPKELLFTIMKERIEHAEEMRKKDECYDMSHRFYNKAAQSSIKEQAESRKKDEVHAEKMRKNDEVHAEEMRKKDEVIQKERSGKRKAEEELQNEIKRLQKENKRLKIYETNWSDMMMEVNNL